MGDLYQFRETVRTEQTNTGGENETVRGGVLFGVAGDMSLVGTTFYDKFKKRNVLIKIKNKRIYFITIIM